MTYQAEGLTRPRKFTVLLSAPERVTPDTGCDVSPSCLTCPLPQCKYDDYAAYRASLRQGRDEQILAYRGEGHSIWEVCKRFNLSLRTVHHRAGLQVLGPIND